MADDNDQMQRLGFEAWADNLIMNLIENLDKTIERDGVCVRYEKYGSETNYIVHAYVPNQGWKTHNRTIKTKPDERPSV